MSGSGKLALRYTVEDNQMAGKKRAVRIGPLDTVGHVVTELGRVYRLARRGELEINQAKSLTYVLREIRCALEASDVERRLEELEEALPSKPWMQDQGAPRHEVH